MTHGNVDRYIEYTPIYPTPMPLLSPHYANIQSYLGKYLRPAVGYCLVIASDTILILP